MQKNKIDVIILGGHGDGLVAPQIILDLSKTGLSIRLLGFLNDQVPIGQKIGEYQVLGKTKNGKILQKMSCFIVF